MLHILLCHIYFRKSFLIYFGTAIRDENLPKMKEEDTEHRMFDQMMARVGDVFVRYLRNHGYDESGIENIHSLQI